MSRPFPRITALILARDEAHQLRDCVACLRWVDEVLIVVDPASTDQTHAVAQNLADIVEVRPFDTFASQRNAGRVAASGDWIFSVDADERSSPEQAREIRQRIAQAAPDQSGFRVPIRSEILGRPFSYSGTQNDRPLRLFRRDHGFWQGEVHETVALTGRVGELETALTHRTLADIRTFLQKLDCYTTLEAIRFCREGHSFRFADITVRPIWTFLKLYLGKQGFRDGLEGFMFCLLSGVSVCVRHWKLRELLACRQEVAS